MRKIALISPSGMATIMAMIAPMKMVPQNRGMDPNAPDESGRTPLWMASRTGGDVIVRRLVEAGGDPNVLPEDIDSEAELRGESPLFYAALHGDEELVAYLWPRTRPEVRSVARSVLAARLRLLDEPAAAESDPVEPGAAPDPAGG